MRRWAATKSRKGRSCHTSGGSPPAFSPTFVRVLGRGEGGFVFGNDEVGVDTNVHVCLEPHLDRDEISAKYTELCWVLSCSTRFQENKRLVWSTTWTVGAYFELSVTPNCKLNDGQASSTRLRPAPPCKMPRQESGVAGTDRQPVSTHRLSPTAGRESQHAQEKEIGKACSRRSGGGYVSCHSRARNRF